MKTVWLLTAGSGSYGDEWHVLSVHESKESAEAFRRVHERIRYREDGSTYRRSASIEEWPLRDELVESVAISGDAEIGVS